MSDGRLKARLDIVEILDPPDLWGDASTRVPGPTRPEPERHGGRAVAAVVATLVALAGFAVMFRAFGGGTESTDVVPVDQALPNTEWVLTSVDGALALDDPWYAQGAWNTVRFDRETLVARSECNRSSASFTVGDGVLLTSDGFTTQVACEGGAGERQAVLFDVLFGSPEISLKQSSMTLATPEHVLLFQQHPCTLLTEADVAQATNSEVVASGILPPSMYKVAPEHGPSCRYETDGPYASVGLSVWPATPGGFEAERDRDPANTVLVDGIGVGAFIHGLASIQVLDGERRFSIGIQHGAGTAAIPVLEALARAVIDPTASLDPPKPDEDVIELPPLPEAGVAAMWSRDSGIGVSFVGLDGTVVATVEDATLYRPGGSPDALVLVKDEELWSLDAAAHRLTRVTESEADQLISGDSGPSLPTPGAGGEWVWTRESPDGSAVLGSLSQQVSECSKPVAMIQRGAEPAVPVTGQPLDDNVQPTFALGWTPSSQALVAAALGPCGGRTEYPEGVYLIDGSSPEGIAMPDGSYSFGAWSTAGSPSILGGPTVGDLNDFKVGEGQFWAADDDVNVMVFRPSENVFYALDLSVVPPADEACPPNQIEGSGQSFHGETGTIVFDCAQGVYARYDYFGTPAAENVEGARRDLPAYEVDVGSRGVLILTDERMNPSDVRLAWGVEL